MKRQKRLLLLGMVLLMAVNLGLKYAAWQFTNPARAPEDDGQDYLALAKSIAHNGTYAGIYGITSARPPLYPLALSVLYRLCRGALPCVRLWQVFLSLALYPLLWLLARRLRLSPLAAWLLLICYTIYPVFLYLPTRILTENLFVPLLLAFSVIFMDYKTPGRLAASAVTAGLAALTRPMFLIFPLFAASYIFIYQRGNYRKALRHTALLCLVMVLTIAPWTLRNYLTWHGFCPITTNSGNTLMINNNDLLFAIPGPTPQNRVFEKNILHPDFLPGTQKWDSMNELQRDRELLRRTFAWIRQHPGRFVRLWPRKLLSFWHYSQNPQSDRLRPGLKDLASLLSYGLLAPFMLLGFFLSLRDPQPNRLFPLLLVCHFTFTTLLFGGSLRFRVPLEPFLMAWAAMALAWLLSIRSKKQSAPLPNAQNTKDGGL